MGEQKKFDPQALISEITEKDRNKKKMAKQKSGSFVEVVSNISESDAKLMVISAVRNCVEKIEDLTIAELDRIFKIYPKLKDEIVKVVEDSIVEINAKLKQDIKISDEVPFASKLRALDNLKSHYNS